VAMPFDPKFDDIFYYGIQTPIHARDLLCERMDQSTFTGDVIERMRQRIEEAVIVIADLSGANPNVNLEGGYAWGQRRPTILLINEDEQPRFDVRGQRQLRYRSIRQLEDMLAKELDGLAPMGHL
jgi:hypothetical protein